MSVKITIMAYAASFSSLADFQSVIKVRNKVYYQKYYLLTVSV